jgi:cyclopropane-fatty-acyl-phospholipid synthase
MSVEAGSETEYRGASAAAIQRHYDLGNEFYALWLDPTRTYSCAIWDGPDDTLEQAQLRKLDYHAAGAGAGEAARMLDIGCGWGAMMRRLIDHHGVSEVVGLTLSDAQAEYVGGWADHRYDVRVENWINHHPDAPYDGIISIGAFEHFADYGMRRAERLAAYREFFDRCREWLPRGGRLSIQTNTKGNNIRLSRETRSDLRFVIERIFTESELPWPSEILEASERRFEVVSLRNDPEEYARTCQAWLDGLIAQRDRAVEQVGEAVVADYERYLRGAVGCFQRHQLGLMRIAFERV